jgi:hypothetical protein
MRILAQVLSYLALVATVGLPLLFLRGDLDLPATHRWMMAGTVLWFLTVPWWMGRKIKGS